MLDIASSGTCHGSQCRQVDTVRDDSDLNEWVEKTCTVPPKSSVAPEFVASGWLRMQLETKGEGVGAGLPERRSRCWRKATQVTHHRKRILCDSMQSYNAIHDLVSCDAARPGRPGRRHKRSACGCGCEPRCQGSGPDKSGMMISIGMQCCA